MKVLPQCGGYPSVDSTTLMMLPSEDVTTLPESPSITCTVTSWHILARIRAIIIIHSRSNITSNSNLSDTRNRLSLYKCQVAVRFAMRQWLLSVHNITNAESHCRSYHVPKPDRQVVYIRIQTQY